MQGILYEILLFGQPGWFGSGFCYILSIMHLHTDRLISVHVNILLVFALFNIVFFVLCCIVKISYGYAFMYIETRPPPKKIHHKIKERKEYNPIVGMLYF